MTQLWQWTKCFEQFWGLDAALNKKYTLYLYYYYFKIKQRVIFLENVQSELVFEVVLYLQHLYCISLAWMCY